MMMTLRTIALATVSLAVVTPRGSVAYVITPVVIEGYDTDTAHVTLGLSYNLFRRSSNMECGCRLNCRSSNGYNDGVIR